ncbi:MAG TPA: Crp/Fnr family transcriptional regulator [Chitinophagaceae bacterium]|nr:Crp/Fnr family transcriptional regulator [Chitinophagaceae bacterium]
MVSNQLKEFTENIFRLPEAEWQAFAAIWQPFSCRRKTMLTAPGETERYLYFVLEGLQRSYYIGENGEEATIVFTYPPSFSGVADSFLTQTPSLYFFETLTASNFLRTTYVQLDDLMNRYPAIQKMILKATAAALKGVLQRQIELQCFSAEEKFKTLLRRSPHVLQIIPHKYLASYLGIDPATFSKLLGTVRLS